MTSADAKLYHISLWIRGAIASNLNFVDSSPESWSPVTSSTSESTFKGLLYSLEFRTEATQSTSSSWWQLFLIYSPLCGPPWGIAQSTWPFKKRTRTTGPCSVNGNLPLASCVAEECSRKCILQGSLMPPELSCWSLYVFCRRLLLVHLLISCCSEKLHAIFA